MLSFLKFFFGGSSPKEPPAVRPLETVEDLRPGDVIEFGYLDQLQLSNRQFTVEQVSTYIYGNLCYPEVILKGDDNDVFYLMYENEDGEEYLALSRKIPKARITAILTGAGLEQLLEEMEAVSSNQPVPRKLGTDYGKLHSLPQSGPEHWRQWLAGEYYIDDAMVKGEFVRSDARYLKDEALQSLLEPFTSWTFIDEEDEKALEFELYSTGEMEVSATVYLSLSAISLMLPGGFQIPEN